MDLGKKLRATLAPPSAPGNNAAYQAAGQASVAEENAKRAEAEVVRQAEKQRRQEAERAKKQLEAARGL